MVVKNVWGVLWLAALGGLGCSGSKIVEPPDNGGPSDGSAGGTGPDASTAPTPFPGDAAGCPAGYRASLNGGQHTGFSAGGQSRSFHVGLPPATFTGPRPLLVVFHGTGLSGQDVITRYGLDEWVAAGFIVLGPDSNGNGSLWPVWDDLDLPGTPPHANADLTLFDELLSCVAGHHEVDARRIYVAGQSAGGAMSNYMLGRRSAVLAGGIPASGTLNLTQTFATSPLEPMIVIMTWGGNNDVYSGKAGDVEIARVGYAEQSSLASQYWESRPGFHRIACRGHEIGHVWINALNAWMRDVLLAHPKGAATRPGWTLPPVPAGAPVSCSEDGAVYVSPITVSCLASTTAGCQRYCQLLGDCFVENGSLGPVMADELVALGFAATGNVCSGCVARCEQDAQGSAADVPVLACLRDAAPACGPGFAGAAMFQSVGTCCGNAGASRVCARFCAEFRKNPLFGQVLSGCP